MGMSTYASCGDRVYKEGFLLHIVFVFFLSYATSCILFG